MLIFAIDGILPANYLNESEALRTNLNSLKKMIGKSKIYHYFTL